MFVSKAGVESFVKIFPEMEDRVLFCNNLVDYKRIQNLSQETINIKKDGYVFINVGRHDEKQKRLTRIIHATQQLKKDGYNFKVWFIGDGQDSKIYKQLVEEYKLQDTIEFLGMKKNPYPYMKLADTVILSSDYEGYPVVFLESFVLNKPIITTDISDALLDIQNHFGIVTKKDENDIYEAMKKMIKQDYKIKEEFLPEEYNKNVLQKIENLIEY